MLVDGAQTSHASTSRRYAAIACVAAIHAAMVIIFVTTAKFDIRVPAGNEIQLMLFNPHLPLARPPVPRSGYTFRLADEVDVPEPQIEIMPTGGTARTQQANQTTERLAPTLDPAHVNEQPELPGTLGKLIAELVLKLEILVLSDGSVFDVHVLKSTGETEIDRLAMQWIKTNWRFLPAIRNGQPIAAPTTVMVRFEPIH